MRTSRLSTAMVWCQLWACPPPPFLLNLLFLDHPNNKSSCSSISWCPVHRTSWPCCPLLARPTLDSSSSGCPVHHTSWPCCPLLARLTLDSSSSHSSSSYRVSCCPWTTPSCCRSCRHTQKFWSRRPTKSWCVGCSCTRGSRVCRPHPRGATPNNSNNNNNSSSSRLIRPCACRTFLPSHSSTTTSNRCWKSSLRGLHPVLSSPPTSCPLFSYLQVQVLRCKAGQLP
mmetsp:Transcript_9573/g.24473  ORF Transcript_9573/g.24473 Transcript_9573/m.24473 type:complete len:227 (-) Transcript_9573:227-907(-)